MTDNWTKCYEDGWKDHIVPEAFSHPAKMSYGLLKRILSHCKDEGWGGVIVDPFGGIGSTGILGAYEGYQVICVELEAKFVALARQNFELHRKAWEQFGNPYPVIIQGDSRRLCELVESADIIVKKDLTNTIVPVTLDEKQENNNEKKMEQKIQGRNRISVFPTENEPKADRRILRRMSTANSHCDETIRDSIQKQGSERQRASSVQGREEQSSLSNNNNKGQVPPMQNDGESGDTPQERRPLRQQHGQSGSPVQSLPHEHNEKEVVESEESRTANAKEQCASGMESVSLIISSPPYEGCPVADQRGKCVKGGRVLGGRLQPVIGSYGTTAGQIGETQGPTFWQAAKEILEQCHKILKPGGHAIWVCKDFVRKGQRVPFSDDWQRLCESAGFKTIHRHKAMLVKEESHKSLFGHDIVKKTERKSFFRRLAEAKGSPKIDEEDVLCTMKPKN